MKQDLEKEMFDLEQELDIPSNLRFYNSKPKQETLEEAAEKLYPRKKAVFYFGNTELLEQEAFENGVKWQKERSYSEQEVLHLLDTLWDRLDIWYNEKVDREFNLIDWFNQCELKKQ